MPTTHLHGCVPSSIWGPGIVLAVPHGLQVGLGNTHETRPLSPEQTSQSLGAPEMREGQREGPLQV